MPRKTPSICCTCLSAQIKKHPGWFQGNRTDSGAEIAGKGNNLDAFRVNQIFFCNIAREPIFLQEAAIFLTESASGAGISNK